VREPDQRTAENEMAIERNATETVDLNWARVSPLGWVGTNVNVNVNVSRGTSAIVSVDR
jgi:hypothetical protein